MPSIGLTQTNKTKTNYTMPSYSPESTDEGDHWDQDELSDGEIQYLLRRAEQRPRKAELIDEQTTTAVNIHTYAAIRHGLDLFH